MPDEPQEPASDDERTEADGAESDKPLHRVVKLARQALRDRGLSEIEISEELQRQTRPDTEAYRPEGKDPDADTPRED